MGKTFKWLTLLIFGVAVIFAFNQAPAQGPASARTGAVIKIPMGVAWCDSLRSITDSNVSVNTCSGFIGPRLRRLKATGTGNDTTEAFSLVNGRIRSVTWIFRVVGRNTSGTIRVGIWLQGLNAPMGYVANSRANQSVAWRNIALVDSISTTRTAAALKSDTSSTKIFYASDAPDTVMSAYTHGRFVVNGNSNAATDTVLNVLIPHVEYPSYDNGSTRSYKAN